MTDTNLTVGYFPVWGATFDSEDIGLVGGNISVFIPDKEEWRQVQKHDVWMESFGNFPSLSLDGPEPPVCIVVIWHIADDEFADVMEQLIESMITDANDTVLALRLLKTGWFLDPAFSEQIFSSGLFNHRLVGPYRQAFIAGVPKDIPQGYALHINELATEKDKVTPVKILWQLIRRYHDEGSNASADIAIENFHRSYGYQLRGTQRATFLFTALDAMLGGMSSYKIGRIKLKAKFKDRLAAAFGAITEGGVGVEINTDTEVDWLDSEGRYIRNAIAHGRPSDVAEEAEKSYIRLQSIVRLLLRQYLEFSIKWASQRVEIGSRISISPECAPAEAYNKILEVSALKKFDVSDLLNFEISKY